MNRLLYLAWLRDWQRRPLQRLLTVLGVLIAVAVVLAVDLANQAAQRAFERSMQQVAGAATHQILGPVEGFPEIVYRDLRLQGWRDLAPVVEGALRLESGATVFLLGIDPLAEAPFRGGSGFFDEGRVRRLLVEPGTVLIPEADWLEWGWTGTEQTLVLPGPASAWTITGLRVAQTLGDGRIWVTDLATAQGLLQRHGRLDRVDVRLDRVDVQLDRVDVRLDRVDVQLDRVDVRLDRMQVPRHAERPGAGTAVDAAGFATSEDALRALLPPGLDLLPVAARSAASRELAQAFRINLTAMSLLALLIAAFLVYNTQAFSVLRRMEVLASLRLLGATRAQIFRLVWFEALLTGALGTGLGALAGIGLAQWLIGPVARTVSDHFFAVAVTSVTPRPLALLAIVLLGLGLSLLAALAPAWEAARGQGMQRMGRMALEQRSRQATGWLLASGALVMGLGGVLIGTAWGGLVGGFLALFLLVTGFLLGVPWMLGWSLRAWDRSRLALWSGPLARLAGRSLGQSLSRSAPAVVALTLALAAAIGVSVLVGSFRVSVADWLGQTLSSDLYVIATSPASARGAPALPGEWIAQLAAWPAVASVSTGSTLEVVAEGEMIRVFVLNPHPGGLSALNLVQGDPENLEERLRTTDAMLVTEAFAAQRGLRLGDRLSIATPMGERPFTLVGVYRDYSHPGGAVLLLPERFYAGPPPRFSSMGLLWRPDSDVDPGSGAKSGTSLAALAVQLEDWLREQPEPALLAWPERIEEQSMAIFDRTFAITHLLRVITLIVAFVAILSALIALQMERAREYAILRSNGLLTGGVVRLALWQGLYLGGFAALWSVPLGLGMGWVLIEVINQAAFGWRMEIRWPLWAILETLAWGWGAALLASLYPAWRLANMPLVPALRVNV
jgi:putative ABC transport system permease protein